MKSINVPGGTVHQLPADLREALVSSEELLPLWESITPLARNEFICWVTSPKQQTTRQRRINRTCEELLNGSRRPCCWIGCIHRDDKPISPSIKGILGNRK